MAVSRAETVSTEETATEDAAAENARRTQAEMPKVRTAAEYRTTGSRTMAHRTADHAAENAEETDIRTVSVMPQAEKAAPKKTESTDAPEDAADRGHGKTAVRKAHQETLRTVTDIGLLR